MKSNTAKHAEIELDILSASSKDPNNRPLIEPFRKEILALVEAFGNSGQSGGSAPLTAGAISQAVKKLCLFEPIGPITGHKSEWSNPENNCYQNIRLSSIFKSSEKGRAYYLDAIVWKGDTKGESGNNWDTFTGTVEGIKSRQFIKSFPFTPKTFYIDVHRIKYNPKKHKVSDAVSCGDGDYVYLIKDKKQLDAVWEYYDKFKDTLK